MNEVNANAIYTATITHSNPVMNCTVSFFIVARMLSIHFISRFSFCMFSFLEFFCVAILFFWFFSRNLKVLWVSYFPNCHHLRVC